jgi:Rieske 2Fe-2S family protein
VVENSQECYHCGAGHPQYCRAVGFAAAIDSNIAAEQEYLIGASQRLLLGEQGIDANPVPFLPGSWHHCRRFFLRDNFATESMDGKPVPPLIGSITDAAVGVLAVVALPNLLLEVSSDYAMLMRLAPISPQVTRADMEWLVTQNAVEGRDYEVSRVTEFWRLTAEQDWKLCEDNQAGINSGRYQPGPYTPVESGVAHFVDWYREALAKP